MSRVNQSNKPEINLLLLPWEIFMLQFESCRAIWTRLLTHRGKNIPSANRNIPCLCQNKTTQHCQRPEQAVSCPHWTSRAVLECWLIFRVCNFGELQTTEVQENSFGLKLSQLGPVFAPWSLQNQATQLWCQHGVTAVCCVYYSVISGTYISPTSSKVLLTKSWKFSGCLLAHSISRTFPSCCPRQEFPAERRRASSWYQRRSLILDKCFPRSCFGIDAD